MKKLLRILLAEVIVVAVLAVALVVLILNPVKSEAESYVLQKIKTMLSFAPDEGRGSEKIISRIEKEEGITYAPQQRQAQYPGRSC